MAVATTVWPPLARRLSRTAGGLLGLAIVWWLAVEIFAIPAYLLPSPFALGPKLVFLAQNAALAANAATTMLEILEGFVLGGVIGIAAGAMFARSPRLERLAAPLVVIVQTAPKIAIAPLLLLWLGLGATPKIVLVSAVVFFPVMAGTMAGLRYVDAAYRDLAAVLSLSRWQTWRRIELPFALPSVLAGLRIATTQAVTAAVIGELMGADHGLGYLLSMGQENADAGIVIAVVVILCLIGWVFHEAVCTIEALAMSWHDSRRGIEG